MTGPSIPYTAAMFQNGGVLPPVLLFMLFTAISTLSCLFIVEAMQAIPGNKHFQGEVEFGTLVNFYFGKYAHILAQICFFGAIQSNAIQSIVLTSQTFDNILLDLFQVTCGISFSQSPTWYCVQSNTETSASPFAGTWMLLTLGFLLVMLFIVPMGMLNFDANVSIQFVIFMEWIISCCIFYAGASKDADARNQPQPLHWIDGDIGQILGNVMQSMAFTYVVPSWVNAKASLDKEKNVNVQTTLWTSSIMTMCMYLTIGILRKCEGHPFNPKAAWLLPNIPDGNVLPILKRFGLPRTLNALTVYLFSLVMLLPNIPVSCIVSRNNLIQNKICSKDWSLFLSFVLPWIIAIPFLTSSYYLQSFLIWSSLVFVSTSNFLVPVLIYLKCHSFRIAYNRDRGILTKKQRELLKLIHHHSREIAKWVDYPQTRDKSNQKDERASKKLQSKSSQANDKESMMNPKGLDFISYSPGDYRTTSALHAPTSQIASVAWKSHLASSDRPNAEFNGTSSPSSRSSNASRNFSARDAKGLPFIDTLRASFARSSVSESSAGPHSVQRSLDELNRASRTSYQVSLHPDTAFEAYNARMSKSIRSVESARDLESPISIQSAEPANAYPFVLNKRMDTVLFSNTSNEAYYADIRSKYVSNTGVHSVAYTDDSSMVRRPSASSLADISKISNPKLDSHPSLALSLGEGDKRVSDYSAMSAAPDSELDRFHHIPAIKVQNVEEDAFVTQNYPPLRNRALSVDEGRALVKQRTAFNEICSSQQNELITNERSAFDIPISSGPTSDTLPSGREIETLSPMSDMANHVQEKNDPKIVPFETFKVLDSSNQTNTARKRSTSLDAGMILATRLVPSHDSLSVTQVIQQSETPIPAQNIRQPDSFRPFPVRELRYLAVRASPGDTRTAHGKDLVKEINEPFKIQRTLLLTPNHSDYPEEIEADYGAVSLDDHKVPSIPFEDMSENEKYLLEDVPDPSQEERTYQKRKEEWHKLPVYVGGIPTGREKLKVKTRFLSKKQQNSSTSEQEAYKSDALPIKLAVSKEAIMDMHHSPTAAVYPKPSKPRSILSSSSKSSDKLYMKRQNTVDSTSKPASILVKCNSTASVLSFGKLELINPNFYRTMSLPTHPGFIATTFRSLPRFVTKRIPARYVAYASLFITAVFTIANLIILIKCPPDGTC